MIITDLTKIEYLKNIAVLGTDNLVIHFFDDIINRPESDVRAISDTFDKSLDSDIPALLGGQDYEMKIAVSDNNTIEQQLNENKNRTSENNIFLRTIIKENDGTLTDQTTLNDKYIYVDCSDMVKKPVLGSIYNFEKNYFIPPRPSDETYVFNEINLEWEPNPNLEYDLNGDGKMYKYDSENNCWIPNW